MNEGSDTKQKRDRSPTFPYVDLSKSIELSQLVYKGAGKNGVRIDDLAHMWNMSAKSGSLARYASALGQFGLLEAEGSKELRRYQLSNDGLRILEDSRPGVRDEMLSIAALKPKVISNLYYGTEGAQKWGSDRPADAIAESALKFDMSFTPDAARRFISVYDETIKYVSDETSDEIEEDNEERNETNLAVCESGAEVDRTSPVENKDASDEHEDQQISGRSINNAALDKNQIQFESIGSGEILITARLDRKGLEQLKKKIEAFSLLLD